jgi:hypothetical protein
MAIVIKGVPFEVAFALTEAELAAFVVTIGELESGQEFNWSTMRWIEKRR